MLSTFLALALCLLGLTHAQNYQQVWADEFNGNTLDTSKWSVEVNCDGGGNNELQCYTSSPSNMVVQNGSLVITAKPQNLNGKQYTSARINTRASAAWKYGRFDFRAKMPNGLYLWPALWMMPRDSVYGGWAASGEIDIMENRGTTNQQESTLHYGGSWPNNVYTGSGPTTMSFDMMADYHIYSAIWTPDSIQFLVDGNVYSTQSLQRSFWSGSGSNPYTANGQPFDQYFYIIINLAVGGGFFGNNANSLTTAQAQAWANPNFYVDYVRVSQITYTPVVNPSPAAPSSAPTTSSSSPLTSSSTNAASTTPAATSAGCPVGICGASSCCNDQRNGIQCYDATMYSCPVDGFNGLNGLCQSGLSLCKGACYNPTSYTCVNGGLVYGATPTPSSSSPKATSSTSSPKTTSSATPTPSSVTPTSSKSPSSSSVTPTSSKSTSSPTPSTSTPKATSSSACPNGCGTGSCCADARMGGTCYSTSSYSCVQDFNGKLYLCGLGTGVCNGACFDSSRYKCVNGALQGI